MAYETDEALFRAALGGGKQAFAELFRLYQGPLYGFLARTTGDATVAEDLLQEVFIRLLRQTTPIEHVRAWLYRTAANLVTDWQRRFKRELLTDDPLWHRPTQEAPGLQAMADGVAERDAIARALSVLTDDQKLVVGLHYFADQPVREVARILGIAEGTVKTRLSRAYKLLAGALEREGGSR